MSEYRWIGKGLPIQDAALKVTGQQKYVDDMTLPRLLHAKMLFSPIPHGNILRIDASEAEKLPGVKAVLHCFNTPEKAYSGNMRSVFHELVMDEHMFSRTVRYVGDRVAAVAAESEEIAAAALRLIHVEYEELPAVFTPEQALAPGAVDINGKGNVLMQMTKQAGNVDEEFPKCWRIYEDCFETPPIHHAALENHVAMADYTADGTLTLWTSTQSAISHRMILARYFELPMNRVRLIAPAMGGGFGGKVDAGFQPVVACLAMRTGRPVKLRFTRRETMISTSTRTAARIRVKTGIDREGHILAQDIDVLTNSGAYATCGPVVIGAMSGKVFKVLKTPNLRYHGMAVYTNTPNGGAMRGYGSPQAFTALGTQYNRIANDLKMDLTDFFAANLIEPDGVEQIHQTVIGNSRPLDCLSRGKTLFGWEEKPLREERGRYLYGKGMNVGCHGNGVFGSFRDMSASTLKMNEDGTMQLLMCNHDMGHGCLGVQQQIVAEVLGLNPSDVTVSYGDTFLNGWNNGESASRGVFVKGGAALQIASLMKELLLGYGAQYFAIPAEQLEICVGGVAVKGAAEKTVSYAQLVEYVHANHQKDLMISDTYASHAQPGSYGAHFVDLQIDKETGEVEILNYVAVHDVGQVINQMALEGQVEGGIQMSMGLALSEELLIGPDGKVQNPNFKRYHLIRSDRMPTPVIDFIQEGEPSGPFGAKSIGEVAAVPGAGAICNAVSNALGCEQRRFPLTPERILRVLSEMRENT